MSQPFPLNWKKSIVLTLPSVTNFKIEAAQANFNIICLAKTVERFYMKQINTFMDK